MLDAFDLHYQTKDGLVDIILKNVRFYCSSCTKWRRGTDFGLRDMAGHGPEGMVPGRHVIRSQPQCKSCRNDGDKLPSRAPKAQRSKAQAAP